MSLLLKNLLFKILSFYDHLIPPVIEWLPNRKPFRYGYRVPCLVISPYAQPGYIAYAQYSHVSILKTIEMIFDLEVLTERDADASKMLECLNFSQPPIAPILFSPRTSAS